MTGQEQEAVIQVTDVARWSRVLADATRLATVISGLVALLWLGTPGWPAFFVVLVVMLPARLLDVARPFEAALCVTLLAATWARAQGWYATVWWVDEAVHLVAPGATAAAAYLMLARLELMPSPAEVHRSTRWFSLALLVTVLGLGLATVWELYEWVEEQFAPAATLVGYDDTISDLALGGLGSLVAGMLLVMWVRARSRARGAQSPHHG